MFPTSIFLSFFLGCGEEVDTGPQFKIDPVNLPSEKEKIVIFRVRIFLLIVICNVFLP